MDIMGYLLATKKLSDEESMTYRGIKKYLTKGKEESELRRMNVYNTKMVKDALLSELKDEIITGEEYVENIKYLQKYSDNIFDPTVINLQALNYKSSLVPMTLGDLRERR